MKWLITMFLVSLLWLCFSCSGLSASFEPHPFLLPGYSAHRQHSWPSKADLPFVLLLLSLSFFLFQNLFHQASLPVKSPSKRGCCIFPGTISMVFKRLCFWSTDWWVTWRSCEIPFQQVPGVLFWNPWDVSIEHWYQEWNPSIKNLGLSCV